MRAKRFLVVILACSFAAIQTLGTRTAVSQAQTRVQRAEAAPNLNPSNLNASNLNASRINVPNLDVLKANVPSPESLEKMVRAASDAELNKAKPAAPRPAVQAAQGPEGDYGDAPDGSLAGYEQPYDQVIGRFPTRYYTTNSRVGRPGAHALTTGQE
ncbi:MAG TPA: hypothetical protein VEZ90_18175, partial [Blastocatellia bacterium]|nr:hypothetical protein [Blastocatellia bacterium]